MVDFLKTAFVHGRLSLGELAHRTGQALEARTRAQLTAVAADIPVVPAPPTPRSPARTPAARRSSPARAGGGVAAGGGVVADGGAPVGARAWPVSRKAIACVLAAIIVLPGLSFAFVDTYYGGFVILLLLAFAAAGWIESYDASSARRRRAPAAWF